MATRPSKPKTPSDDLDVRRAESAAETLLAMAAELKTGKSLGARALIRRTHGVLFGVTERDATWRESLLGWCRMHGDALRLARKNSVVPPERNPVEAIRPNLTRSVLDKYAFYVPEHTARIEKNADLVWALVSAHAKLPGAKTVPEASEALTKAMGFHATKTSSDRTARRRRQRARERDA